MSNDTLTTYGEVAREFGVYGTTIGDLVRALGIPQRTHPRNRNAKALTPEDVTRLREVLVPREAITTP